MAEHEHGTMNTDVQEKTFNGFVTFVTRTVIVILAILVFLAIFGRFIMIGAHDDGMLDGGALLDDAAQPND